MNKTEAKQLVDVMLAWIDGKPCQIAHTGQDNWIDLNANNCDFSCDYEYRIAPEPMEIEVWVSGVGSLSLLEKPSIPELAWTLRKFREVL